MLLYQLISKFHREREREDVENATRMCLLCDFDVIFTSVWAG